MTSTGSSLSTRCWDMTMLRLGMMSALNELLTLVSTLLPPDLWCQPYNHRQSTSLTSCPKIAWVQV